MSDKTKNDGFAPQEHLISILPSVLAGIFMLLATIATALVKYPLTMFQKGILIGYGVVGNLYLSFFYLLYISTSKNKLLYAWINAVLVGISLGLLSIILPDEMWIQLSALMIVASISTSIVSERGPSYFIVLSSTLISSIANLEYLTQLHQRVIQFSLIIAALIVIETIQQLKYLSRQQINRLEIVNEFSRQIASSLDTEQVTSLLNAAIQNALEADTYYVGMVEGEEISLHLFYDEGEYFKDVHANMEGTLSGWVVRNRKGLFLPDLRRDVNLTGVKTVIIGKQKTSLSWMGVPMQGEFVNGIIAIACYRPNAFNRSDMELLSNMAQRAALALDNSLRHALVEEQAHVDSLTGVYNHGYFIKILRQQAETTQKSNQHLSLIMLDVDYFKQYNDNYGHLAGDEILTKLCETIRRHVKHSDTIGRWGGEEFAISLPDTSGAQAMQVANRIRETMSKVQLRNRKKEAIPAPTISQGIAEFPVEADEIFKLIDLADRRLYIAKERGRDQVEPSADRWDQLQKLIN